MGAASIAGPKDHLHWQPTVVHCRFTHKALKVSVACLCRDESRQRVQYIVGHDQISSLFAQDPVQQLLCLWLPPREYGEPFWEPVAIAFCVAQGLSTVQCPEADLRVNLSDALAGLCVAQEQFVNLGNLLADAPRLS